MTAPSSRTGATDREVEAVAAIVHKLNAYTGFGRRGECAVTHPALNSVHDWEAVTCPACLREKPAALLAEQPGGGR